MTYVHGMSYFTYVRGVGAVSVSYGLRRRLDKSSLCIGGPELREKIR